MLPHCQLLACPKAYSTLIWFFDGYNTLWMMDGLITVSWEVFCHNYIMQLAATSRRGR